MDSAEGSLTDLVEPLRQPGRDPCGKSESDYVLLAHDWCKLDYKNHTSKADLRQITHQTEIVLHRPHSAVIDGQKRQVHGEPLPVRLVVTRLLDDNDFIVAEWTLLTNVFDDGISAHQIALW
ncbi:MAG: hypothetical protein ACKVHE_07020 [Planctomycetales bacterium]|jgi:hypothetical protein